MYLKVVEMIRKDTGSLTVSGQRIVKYSIKIVSILSLLDYVIASPIENVKSRLVPTSLETRHVNGT